MLKEINNIGVVRCGGTEQYIPSTKEYEEALAQAEMLLKEDQCDYVENYLMPYDKKYDSLMKDMNIVNN